MTTIEEAVENLASDQAPVICLDTCDFLDVVRGVAEENLFHAGSFRDMVDTLDVDSKRFCPLITYLVRHEWEQNKESVRIKVERYLVETAASNRRVSDARKIGGLPVISIDDSLSDGTLAQRLIELAEDLMNHAVVLEKDDSCVARALERVMSRRRPSHNNQIKDSIHWEHYLELSRLLGIAGHSQDRIFVSANKADFWASRDNPAIHTDLSKEAAASGLRFFGRLDEALRDLGI